MINLIEEVKERIPLRSVLDAYLGQPVRERYRCPFHPTEDMNPSLKMRPDCRSYKCWSCPASGTVVDLAMFFEGIAEPYPAAKWLAEKYLGATPADWSAVARTPRPTPAPKVAKPKPAHWRSAAWQAAAAELLEHGRACLAGRWGVEGRRYLAEHGIGMGTAARFGLAYFPEDVASPILELPEGADGSAPPERIIVPRGLAFPWLAPGASPHDDRPRLVGANVRRLGPMPPRAGKWKTFEGSERGHGFPYPRLDPSQVGPPALIFEGEPDALLAWQEAGDLGHPFSVGGASQTDVDPATLAALALCPRWLIVGDYDESGFAAAERWLDRSAGCGQHAPPPRGKDLCDAAGQGHDVRAWIKAELSARGMLVLASTGRPPPDLSRFGPEDLGDPETGMGDAYEGDLPDNLPRLVPPPGS